MNEKLDNNLDKAYEQFSQDHEQLREELIGSLADRKAKRRIHIFTRSKIAKLAVAAMIIFAIGLFFVGYDREKQIESYPKPQVVKSPAELMTLLSINIAFRDGGIEAVEKQFDMAEKKVRPMLKERVTLDQLICELEGNCEEI